MLVRLAKSKNRKFPVSIRLLLVTFPRQDENVCFDLTIIDSSSDEAVDIMIIRSDKVWLRCLVSLVE